MSPRIVRRLLVATCAAGVAGMIATSIADATGAALAIGLVTAASAGGLMLVTAVTDGGANPTSLEHLGEEVELRVEELVTAGADPAAVRGLVRAAVRLGRRDTNG